MCKITEEKICAFEKSLKENERSEATVQKYVANLRKLMMYLDGEEITKMNLLTYRDFLKKDHASQTVNGAISAINAYLEENDLEDYKMKLLKLQRQTFRPEERQLTKEEYARLVEAARHQGKERLLLIIETICSSGIRISELKYITVETAKNGRSEISLKGKNRLILLPKCLCKKLLNYAKEQGIVSGELFITKYGKSLSRQRIWSEMKALCKEAHVEESKVFPHNLRHLFARTYYEASHDVVKLADMMGHSSVETTRMYLISTGEELSKTLEHLQLVF